MVVNGGGYWWILVDGGGWWWTLVNGGYWWMVVDTGRNRLGGNVPTFQSNRATEVIRKKKHINEPFLRIEKDIFCRSGNPNRGAYESAARMQSQRQQHDPNSLLPNSTHAHGIPVRRTRTLPSSRHPHNRAATSAHKTRFSQVTSGHCSKG